jgi:hypothetical protein
MINRRIFMSIKKKIGGTYWGRLFYRDKPLFFVISLFFALSLFFNLIRLNITPFFLFDMYAVKMPSQPDYSLYELRYGNGRRVDIPHTWEQSRKLMLFEPLSRYASMAIGGGGKDPFGEYLKNDWGVRHPRFRSMIPYLYDSSAQFNAFPAWFKRYLSPQLDGPVGHIYVLKKTVGFDANGWVREISSDTTLVIP